MRNTNVLLMVFLCGLVLAGCSRDPNVRKQKYFKSGMEYLDKGKANQAMIQFRNAVKVDPHFAEAWAMLGRVQISQRQIPDAYKSLLNAIAAKPDYLPAR